MITICRVFGTPTVIFEGTKIIVWGGYLLYVWETQTTILSVL
jgi:hypothetical protein